LEGIAIGETLADPEYPQALERITVEETDCAYGIWRKHITHGWQRRTLGYLPEVTPAFIRRVYVKNVALRVAEDR
jgi:hypothetical protein